jgi:predicted MFS family arabinose efflux permease
VPDEYRGQAIGFASSGLVAVQGIGVAVGGLIAQATTPSTTIAAAGILGTLLACGVAVAWWRLYPRADAANVPSDPHT